MPRLQALATVVVVAVLAGAIAAATSPVASQPRKLKVHISVDMEGVAGTVTADQLGPPVSSTAASVNS